MKTFYLESFGCAMNQADAQYLKEILTTQGYSSTKSPNEASILLVNTCTVRETTQDKMLSRIKLLTEISEKQGAPLIVSGCLASAQPALVKAIAKNSVLLPPRSLASLKELLRVYSGESVSQSISEGCRSCHFTAPRSQDTFAGFSEGVSFTLPISEGCLGHCAYCIVRNARGGLVSFPANLLLQRITDAVSRGAKEIRITAQDTGVYGQDKGFAPTDGVMDLPDLLRSVTTIEGNFLIRVGMMNPNAALKFLPRLLDVYSSPKLYKFLHLPVQSGSDNVLQAMGRGYSAAEFLTVVREFRHAYPESTLATDIIVAFPGETEDDFRQTCDILLKARPEKVHAARFSRREGTPAAKLPLLPSHIARKRTRELAELRLKIAQEENQKRVGQVLPILITGASAKGQIGGRTLSYRPVIINSLPSTMKKQDLMGRIIPVEITDAGKVDLKGRIIVP